MKRMLAVLCMSAMGVLGVAAAQTGETKMKSKVTVEHGDSIKVTGCVARAAMSPGFILTNVASKEGALYTYILVADEDLSRYVGWRVELRGNATDRGDGKVKIETETKTDYEHGRDSKTHTESEIKGGAARVPYLGVKSIKAIAAACP